MNKIDEIKKRVKEEFYIKRDIDFYEAQEDISYLLSIIEQAEKALKKVYERDGYKFVDDVLKAIQGDE